LLGDGHKTLTCEVCHELTVEVNGCCFVVDAYLFDLEDIDLILGMAWLSSLGEMRVDWRRQIMKINTSRERKF